MQFSLIDLKMNGTSESMNELHPPYLINVATLPCESQNTENIILQGDITKENSIRCILASSKWTRVIMCLTFTYLGCYKAKCVWNKNSWHQRLVKTLDANLFWLWPDRKVINAGVTVWDHVCMLVMDTLNACCDMNVHLYDSPEHFMKLSIDVIWCM